MQGTTTTWNDPTFPPLQSPPFYSSGRKLTVINILNGSLLLKNNDQYTGKNVILDLDLSFSIKETSPPSSF